MEPKRLTAANFAVVDHTPISVTVSEALVRFRLYETARAAGATKSYQLEPYSRDRLIPASGAKRAAGRTLPPGADCRAKSPATASDASSAKGTPMYSRGRLDTSPNVAIASSTRPTVDPARSSVQARA